jgi:glycine/D-amino acid oxidase-like deaminating enzyme
VRIIEDCQVKQILTEKQRAGQYDRVTSAITAKGPIKCDVFINCTGLVRKIDSNRDLSDRIRFQWARDLGFQSSPSVRIPTQACGKFVLVSLIDDEQSSYF